MDDFCEDGLLAKTIAGFRLREAQQVMAKTVTTAIENNQRLVVEAGTGTGKTFAYLVPALRSGKKVIISTGSKNLQDQLFIKDLPLIKEALHYSGQIALLKGRSNYVCLERLNSYFAAGGELFPETRAELTTVRQWSLQTMDGDISKCTTLTEDNPIWSLITSIHDSCLGADCPDYDDCYVMKARRRAAQADIIIINHHLFFADRVVKDSGFGALLPQVDVMIFDEAHQLPDLGCHYFGFQLSTKQIKLVAKEIAHIFHKEIKDMVQLQKCAAKLDSLSQESLSLFNNHGRAKRDLKQALRNPVVANFMERLQEGLSFCHAVLELASGRNKTLDNCLERVNHYAEIIDRIIHNQEREYSAIYEWFGKQILFSLMPLSIAERFNALMTKSAGSWIFTSATLAIDHSMAYFAQRLGLGGVKTLILGSPFNYQQQTLLCVPRYIPSSQQKNYVQKLIAILLPVIEVNQGRCFCLCTSHHMMNALAQGFRKTTELPILVQGETNKTQLLYTFINKGNAILIATQSFWEGIDVKGDVLSCVIIDKLPFTPPDDPLTKARIAACSHRGGDPFTEIQIPEAVISLKQGVGRLIRDQNDRGVIIICDNRLVNRYYGVTFLNSLPVSPRTRDLGAVIQFLKNEQSTL